MLVGIRRERKLSYCYLSLPMNLEVWLRLEGVGYVFRLDVEGSWVWEFGVYWQLQGFNLLRNRNNSEIYR